MNEQAINEAYLQIELLIKQKRIKEALVQLNAFLWHCTDWELRNRLEQVQTSYHYMLQYMLQGVADPERKVFYTKLQASVLEILDQARLVQLDGASSRYYHEHRRSRKSGSVESSISAMILTLESFNDDLAVSDLLLDNKMDEVIARHEQALKLMFLQTWTNSAWTSQDEAEAESMLDSELLPVNALCLFTSAVTLSLMTCFDPRKMTWLMNAYEYAPVFVSQRALVGISFTLYLFHERLPYYPEIGIRMELLNEKLPLGADLARIQKQILLAQDTEAIDRKMREEIIPEMLKNVSSMRDMKLGIEEFDDEKDDTNSDWKELFEHTGLSDKLQEMNELQMEGADVYMSTFSALKNNFFFRELQNWFYPFDKQHSSISKILKQERGKGQIMELILNSGFFCNSDKYSLFFIMQTFPQSQRDMVFSQLTEQNMNDLTAEGSNADSLKRFAERPDTVSNQYLHDLYRFFKLNQRRQEFQDLFKESIRLYDIPELQEMICQPDLLLKLADFQLKKKHWKETEELYKKVESMNSDFNSEYGLYQRMGYAQQMQKKYEEAIGSYLTADLLKPDNAWTNRHLATCYRMTHEFDNALTYYRKVEETADNANIALYIGSCLVELQRYEEALKLFFKLDFLENNNLKAWRGIGWCSFVSGKYEQAMKYYDRVVSVNPVLVDYLNAGHISWALGHREKAVTLYGKALELSEGKNAFLELFDKDRPTLIQQGIIEEDIPLMLDLFS